MQKGPPIGWFLQKASLNFPERRGVIREAVLHYLSRKESIDLKTVRLFLELFQDFSKNELKTLPKNSLNGWRVRKCVLANSLASWGARIQSARGCF